MEINDYQKQIREYADYPIELGPFTLILDMQSTLGNLSNKLNDSLINDHGNFTKKSKTNVAISLGNIFDDICNMAFDLGFTMNDIISLNMTRYNMENEKKNNANKK